MSERYLIVRLGSLGDVIHAIPAAAALRRHFPGARIDWAVDGRYVELLSLVRGLDRVIPANPRGGVSPLVRTIRELRRGDYDCAFDMQGLIKSAVLARAAGARQTVGFARAHLRERAAALFYTTHVAMANDQVPISNSQSGRWALVGGPHVIRKNMSLLTAVGVDDREVIFPQDVPRTPVCAAATLRAGGEYALINPGAAWPNKRWPPDRFGAVAGAIRDRLRMRSLVLWGPGEEPLARAVVSASSGAAEISPATSIVDLFAIARGARLMVSGDTGPLHVAAAVGTPVIALFGPTSADRNGPWSPEDVSISRMDACACLYERRCRRRVPCIDDISVAEVVRAIEHRVSAGG